MRSLIFIIIFVMTILISAVRGLPGNISESDFESTSWTVDGPFELSVERGRFALIYSMIENKSFEFSVPVARFAVPDLGLKNGKYVSLFAPGVSFLVAPGYIVGKMLGASQVGTFLMISLFALFNFVLVKSIAQRLGANTLASTLGAIAFLFATPAFAYSTTLYQHHVSTLLVLGCIYVLVRWNNLISLSLIWFLCAASIPIDYPNLFFLFPLGVLALGRFIKLKLENGKLEINIKFKGFLTLLAMLLPLTFFAWFNNQSYGSPWQFSGTVAQVKDLSTVGHESERVVDPVTDIALKHDRSALHFFRTRGLLNGFHILLASPDRGLVTFAPVMLLGVLGAIFLYKRNTTLTATLVAVIGFNILLYAMWGDVWGGWAFGSRYLVPTYAILGIWIAIALSHWRKNLILLATFVCLFTYSLAVNTLGALTSSRNPPRVEVLALEAISGQEQKYTWERNLQFLQITGSKSFVYQVFAKNYLTAVQYYYLITGSVLIVAATGIGALYFSKHEAKF
jgi:hypothetical protein